MIGEQTAHDDLAKSNETVRELKRINQVRFDIAPLHHTEILNLILIQGLIEDRALIDAKTSAQRRKDERLRSRLEAELARQKDLAHDAADEASRLRAALQVWSCWPHPSAQSPLCRR